MRLLPSLFLLALLFICPLVQAFNFEDKTDKKYVILKLDDVVDGPDNQIISERWLRVTHFLEEKKLKAAFGIIGYSLVEDNLHYFQWIKDTHNKGLVEFWNHGFLQRKASDKEGEFEKDFATQYRSLFLTDSLAKAKLGLTLNTWGPHWSNTNEYTDSALAAIPSLQLTFGYPASTKHFKGIILPRIIDLEYPVHNPDFASFVKEYNKLSERRFLSYLQGHPNSWNNTRWSEFVKIIEFLMQEGYEFITPSEFLTMLKHEKSVSFYNRLLNMEGLAAFWNFKEKSEDKYYAVTNRNLGLIDVNNSIHTVEEGPLWDSSISFDGKSYLMIPNQDMGKLNITGSVTVLAWIKWEGNTNSFIAGPWNEYQDGGKRQYGLFVSLPHYNGRDQVCGHISKTGKPTPPFPYSIDYSASKQIVPTKEWCCVGFTYDGEYIKSYLNGVFEAREPELIDHTKRFEGYPDGLIQSKNPYYFPDGIGDNGSDFTVGAVLLKSGMGNFFKGQIGGIAVFSRALSEEEMKEVSITN